MPVDPTLLEMSEVQLYEIIGRDIMRPLRGSGPIPPPRLIQSGKNWLAEKQESIQLSVCSSATIKILAENSDALTLVEAIAALLSALFTDVKPAPVAALLFKIGVHKYCKDHWQSPAK